jgi:hypothetical protein
LNRSPKYLSDQDGAFEAKPCDGRPGKCLEQVIVSKPIAWGAVANPFTLAGNAAWTDYAVSADLRFLTGAPAVLLGRIDTADNFQDNKAIWPSSYLLRLQPDGAWALISTQMNKPPATLASGTARIDRNQWHRMELRFAGKRITAMLDGAPLATVEDATHTHGMFALGTEWDRIQFDNLRVTR